MLLATLEEHCGADGDHEGDRDCRETDDDERTSRAPTRRLVMPARAVPVVGVDDGVSLPTRDQVAVQRVRVRERERNQEGEAERTPEQMIIPSTSPMAQPVRQ